MAANSKDSSKNNTQDQEVEVLYQKLGGQWFAFSIIEDEVFMSPVAEDTIEEIRKDRHAEA